MKRTEVEADLSGARAPQQASSPTEERKDGSKTVGEWALLKGHDAAAFNAKRAAEKRPLSLGDRHGIGTPDVEVIRAHMIPHGWREDWRRTGDAVVTEAEYDAAAQAAYSIPGAGTSHPKPTEPAETGKKAG